MKYYDYQTKSWTNKEPEWWSERRKEREAARALRQTLAPQETPHGPSIPESEFIEAKPKEPRWNYVYTPTKPWDGISIKRFPQTWNMLVRFYFSDSYYKETRFVSEYAGKPNPFYGHSGGYPYPGVD